MSRTPLVLLLTVLCAATADAHYNMLLPAKPWAKTDEKVTFTHQWGHPFEHELDDAPSIRQLYVIAPDGKRTDLAKTVESVKVPGMDAKPVRAHRFDFTPARRGDYTFVLATDPMYLADLQESVQDIVKVVLHVQTQNGWDVGSGDGAELVPLTRPYGLLPGMAFQARATRPQAERDSSTAPLADALVEYERFNEKPIKHAPEDEFITFRTKTDRNGVLTCTLPQAGWWGITVLRPAGTTAVDGKMVPLKQRLTLWVHVDGSR
jgi:cobalt/nickel transport protein